MQRHLPDLLTLILGFLLEDPNLLRLRTLDSYCPFFLGDTSILGFGDNELQCSKCYDREAKLAFSTSRCCNRQEKKQRENSKLGRTPKGAYTPRGHSEHLLEHPLLRPPSKNPSQNPFFYCKTHSRPPSQNPSENPWADPWCTKSFLKVLSN